MRRSKTALIAAVLATGAAASVGWALQGSGLMPSSASASARSPRLMLRHGQDYMEMKEYDRASNSYSKPMRGGRN